MWLLGYIITSMYVFVLPVCVSVCLFFCVSVCPCVCVSLCQCACGLQKGPELQNFRAWVMFLVEHTVTFGKFSYSLKFSLFLGKVRKLLRKFYFKNNFSVSVLNIYCNAICVTFISVGGLNLSAEILTLKL